MRLLVILLAAVAVLALPGQAAACDIRDAIHITVGHVDATTDGSENIGATTATLRGEGSLGTAAGAGASLSEYYGYFFYGLDPNLLIGNATPQQQGQLGSISYGFSANVSGLIPNMTYYFQQLVYGKVKDAVGVHYHATCAGSIMSFTTLLAPPTLVTSAADAITGTDATVHGTVNPNGSKTAVQFVVTPTGGGPSITTPAQQVPAGSSAVPVSYRLIGLEPSTEYSFVLQGSNANNSGQSSATTFTTGPAPPRVHTGEATGVTATGATLNGSIDPNGAATDYHFEWGETTSYGNVTPTASAGSGSQAVPVSAPIDGLVPGRTYHYRLVATSSGGSASGPDSSFVASPGAFATTLAASDLSATAATLNGTVDPRGVVAQAWFDWGADTGSGGQYTDTTPVQALDPLEGDVPLTARLTGLTPGTTYDYRVRAVDSIGGAQGGPRSFTTPVRAPVVTTGAGTGPGADGGTLTGGVNPGGAATNWWFEYGPTDAYGSSTAPQAAGSGSAPVPVSSALSGLEPNRTYHFRVVGENAAGTTAGADSTLRTVAAPAATTLASANVGTDGATLLGQVDPLNSPTRWWIEYGADAGYGRATTPLSAGDGLGQVSVSRTLSGLAPGTTYHYRVVAMNADGRVTRGADATFQTAQPPAVTPPEPVVPAPPAAATGRVASRSRTSATVTGSVDPRGQETAWFVEFGPTRRLGRATRAQTLGAAQGTLPVRAALRSLRPGRRYHYRVVATSAAGTVYGARRTFKTAKSNRRGKDARRARTRAATFRSALPAGPLLR
jgi:hypothetical protein